MRIPSFLLTCAAAGITLGAAEFNPMQWPEYQQTLTLEFADADAAQKAAITVRPLPGRKTLVFSARWDDTSASHANTIEIMHRQGAKGTFFYNRMTPDGNRVAKRILECGSSIGVHTVTHRDLATVNPEAIFHDVMRNRLEIETTLQTPATTVVLPYCSFTNLYPYSAEDVGKTFFAAGLIGAPDVFYPTFGDRLKVPYTGFAESKPITAGDRKVDLPKFLKRWQTALNDAEAIAKHPSLSVAMHSWHPAEELPVLEEAFRKIAGRSEVWYCNQNDYAAYRYECFQTPQIVKKDGKTVTISLRRVRPDLLGARPELYLESTHPVISVKGGTLAEGLIRVPADAAQPDVAKYALAMKNGKVADIPGIAVKFTRPADGKWLLTVTNKTGETITGVNARVHLSPRWSDVSRVPQMQNIPAGETAEFAFTAKTKDLLRFRFGNPYSAVSFEATIAGERCRIYADLLEEKKEYPASEFSAIKAFAGLALDDKAAAALSVPGTKFPAGETTQIIFQPANFTAPGCAYIMGRQFSLVKTNPPVYGVLDFKSGKAQDLTIRTTHENFYLNGKKLPKPQKNQLTLSLKPGVNRLVVTGILGRKWQLFLNDPGAANAAVEFLP